MTDVVLICISAALTWGLLGCWVIYLLNRKDSKENDE